MYDFTPRELQVIKLVAKGLSDKEIASYLEITPPTARFHITNIAKKMNVTRKTEIAVVACRAGLA